MKIFEIMKCVNEKELKILGLSVIRYGSRKIINGSLAYIDVFPINFQILSKIAYKQIHEIQFCGHPLIQYDKYHIHFFSKQYSVEQMVVQDIFRLIDEKYDGIILLRSALGESYLINFLVKGLSNKYKLNNVCFAYVRPIQKEWTCFSHIPFEKLEIIISSLKFLKRKFYKKGNRFLFICVPFEDIKSMVLSYKHCSDKISHFRNLIKYFGIDVNQINVIKPCFQNTIKDKCKSYLKHKNININKFIFLSKDAISTENLPNSYWKYLEERLENIGYSLCYNSKELTISEACYIASLSSAVICNRSGFSEGLSNVAKKMFVFYTPMISDISLAPNMIMNAYSLKDYPGVNNPTLIYEYNVLETNWRNIVESIITNLKMSEV